jgi:hypothetical protein
MRWPIVVVSVLLMSGCLTLTPEGARVAVYKAPLDGPPAKREMPDGCRKISGLGEDRFSETEIEGQADPYRRQRNTVGGAGGNVLLVLMQQTSPRVSTDCPKGAPIGDCPGYSGASYKVVFESYECTPEALKILSTPK